MRGFSIKTPLLLAPLVVVVALSVFATPAVTFAAVAGTTAPESKAPESKAPAVQDPAAKPSGVPGPSDIGFLLEDSRRYPTTSVVPRVAYDLIAIPANIPLDPVPSTCGNTHHNLGLRDKLMSSPASSERKSAHD